MGFFLVLGCVVAVSTSWAMATAVPLLVAHTTALIMGGTFHPLVGPKDKPAYVTSYLDSAVFGYLNPAFAEPVTNAVAVFTPEEFFPIGRLTLDKSVAEGQANLHRCVAAGAGCAFNDDAAVVSGVGPSVAPQVGDSFEVFGYSQSAVIASLAKRDLIRDYQAGDPAVSFMLVANPMRPNGGVLMRGKGLPAIPILGISFAGASPTDSAVLPDGSYANPTFDMATQYDALGGDFPVRPLNLLALVNALFGYGLLHGATVDVPFDRARYQGREGDTSYYLIETDILPILQPLAFIVPKPILKAIDAPMRVIIEDAYNREISPGTPTPFSWWPIKDVFKLVENLIKSMPVAVDNLFEGFGLSRVLGTKEPGTFGVGGPDLPDDPGVAPVAALQSPQEVGRQAEGASTTTSVSAEAVAPDADPMTEPDEPAEVTDVTSEELTPSNPTSESDGPGVGTEALDAEELGTEASDAEELDAEELDAEALDAEALDAEEPGSSKEPEPEPELAPADSGAADAGDVHDAGDTADVHDARTDSDAA